jgi:hypothetical protein
LYHVSKKLSMKNRRGVSQIIGSLIVLAVVASVGSVILFQGLNQINAFNHDLSFHDREYNEALREDILFEHVRFDPNSSDLILYLANVGSIDTTIASVTVVKVDTQELILAWEDVPAINGTILIEDHKIITLDANLLLGTDNIWNSTEYGGSNSTYKISITTSKGNFISDVKSPGDNFNS